MGTHYEGVDAGFAHVAWAAPLTAVGDDTLGAGMYALTIDQVIIEGDVNAILRVAKDVATIAEQVRRHSLAPLTHADFAFDEDGEYVCPVCGGGFEPDQYGSLTELIQAIDAEIDGHNRERERAEIEEVKR